MPARRNHQANQINPITGTVEERKITTSMNPLPPARSTAGWYVYAMGGGYVNFHMDEPDRVRGMYGANYDRLARVKAQYDPDNVFRVNQNIAPAA